MAHTADPVASGWRSAALPGSVRSARLLALALVAVLLAAAMPATAASSGAVLLMYHRFGEDNLPSTSVTIEQFERHVETLTSGSHHVVPLAEIVSALAEGRTLPDRTVAITVDDTSRSLVTEAFPRFRAAGLPFTVFVDTDAVSRSQSSVSWDDVRRMHSAGVTIGAHSAAHGHMAFMDRGAVEEDLARMTADFLRELGFVPKLFAYPYGEYGADLVAMVKDAGYEAAFGQHSGVATEGADLFTLPRFALNERFGAIDRFATIIDTLPLQVTDILPHDMPLRGTDANPPAIGFTVLDEDVALDRLACFASNGGEIDLALLGQRAEIRIDRPFPPGRSRLNCTIPGREGRFHWLGIPFLVPDQG